MYRWFVDVFLLKEKRFRVHLVLNGVSAVFILLTA